MNNFQQIESAYKNDRLPQAMLLVGPQQSDLLSKICHLILCQSQGDKPCMQCTHCQMVSRVEHPDIYWVKPEKKHGSIKIDQIREINHSAYLTSQRGSYKIIIIESADRMNRAATNALLKTLEEPAANTLFILLAQQLSTILPTILSRCQIFRMTVDAPGDTLDPVDKQRDIDVESLTHEIIELLEGKRQPFAVIERWGQLDIHDLLKLLYLIYAQVQLMYFNSVVRPGSLQEALITLKSKLNPLIIFNQLSKINAILKKLSHNININTTMALEELVLILLNDSQQ